MARTPGGEGQGEGRVAGRSLGASGAGPNVGASSKAWGGGALLLWRVGLECALLMTGLGGHSAEAQDLMSGETRGRVFFLTCTLG